MKPLGAAYNDPIDTSHQEPADGPIYAVRVLEWVNHSNPTDVVDRLEQFRDWITKEALVGGGIGPDEGERLWRRHLADSLTFLAALHDVPDVVDVGSGVGLPGIPLAIALPETGFTLLDRSERRCWLARRAVRVLELENVEVVQGDATKLSLPHAVAVSRASLPIASFFATARSLLPNGRLAVVAGSHGVSEPSRHDYTLISVPPGLLESAAWLATVSLSGGDVG